MDYDESLTANKRWPTSTSLSLYSDLHSGIGDCA